MDSSVSTLERTFFSFQHPLSLRIEKAPSLAPLPELGSELNDIKENYQVSSHCDQPSPQFSYLPSPPLRVSNVPSKKFNSSETLERALSVPAIRFRRVVNDRMVRSWNEHFHTDRRIHGTEFSPDFSPETSESRISQVQLDELFARTHHSPETFDDVSETPDPLLGLVLGPRQPPFPIEPTPVRGRIESTLFPDPLTEFMEDRMILFRPTSSQNNVESLLNNTHPYQAQPDLHTESTVGRHGRSRWSSIRNSVFSVASGADETSDVSGVGASGVNSQFFIPIRSNALSGIPGSAISDHQSSGSFLQRNHSLEPPALTMVYTPRAVPLSDLSKDHQPTRGGCGWCI